MNETMKKIVIDELKDIVRNAEERRDDLLLLKRIIEKDVIMIDVLISTLLKAKVVLDEELRDRTQD